MDEQLAVQNNTLDSRFEVAVGGSYALIAYILEGDTILFTHTEVPPALEGQGIASRMAHTALEYAQSHGLTVVPLCPFVASYIKRHQEYAPLVHPDHRWRVAA